MSFLSGMKVFGKDIEVAFAWFGSPAGKAIVATGEAAIEEIVPVSTPLVNLFNAWAAKAYNVEAIAVAAGKATGTGAEKAVIVEAAIESEVLQYAQQDGLAVRTATQIQDANDGIIKFINAMTQAPVAPVAAPVQITQGNVTISIPSTAVSASAQSGTLL